MSQQEQSQLTYTDKARYLRPLMGKTLPGLFLLLLFAVFLIPGISLAGGAPSPPTSTITAPANSATLGSGDFPYTITGTATPGRGNAGVTGIEVNINSGGWVAATCTSCPGANGATVNWTYSWSQPADGSYTIQSRATDDQPLVEVAPFPSVTVTVSSATTTTTTLAPTTTTTTLAPTTTTTTLAPTTTTTTLAPTTTTTTLAPTTTTTTLAPTTTTTTLAPTTTTTTLAPTTTTTTLAPTTTTTTLAPTTTTTTLAPTTTTTTLAPTTTTTTLAPTTTTTTTTPTSTTTTTLPGNDPSCRSLTPDRTVCASGCTHTTISDAFSAGAPGDVICVKDSGSYGGFTFPTTGFTLVGEYIASRPHLTGTVTFSDSNGKDPYTHGAVLDGFIIDANSPSMYMKGSCDTTVTIGNNVKVRNTLFDGGGKPAIKWEGGCATIGPGNTFRNKARTAIRFYNDSTGKSDQAVKIINNDFYGNGADGSGKTMYAHIHTAEDNAANRYILIKDNTIHDSAFASGFGIDDGSNDYLYLTGNDVYSNPWGGFRLGTEQAGSNAASGGKIIISGEPNYNFANESYTDGSPNIFRSNGRGGISIGAGVTMDIIRNEIKNNNWGGIHTGWQEPVSGSPEGEYTWPTTLGDAVLTIRKNKVFGNGDQTATAGGGIDVMHASGFIENNLVYDNDYAGIRVGDGVLSGMTIRHNTVVDNGGGSTPESSRVGGGIVYHDGYDQAGTTPCYYCRPYGTIPSNINVKDNVIAYNSRAALAGMGFTNTVGSEERDYNLIYSNNPGAWFWTADCGYVAAGGDYSTNQMDFRCLRGQYGFDPLYNDGTTKTQDPNDILAPPLFTDRANDVYTLKPTGSGGLSSSDRAASDSGDKGAWGGSDPIDW